MAKKVVAEEKSGSGESGSGRWMLTYLDMVTLLFGVFVILYAMSKIDENKATAVAEALRLGFQGGTSVDVGPMSGGRTILEDMLPEGVTRRRVRNRAMALFRAEVQSNLVKVSENELGISISLVGSDNFASGSAKLTVQTEQILRKAAPFLMDLDFAMRMEGHADEADSEVVYQREIYESSWELASQRSVNVLKFLQSFGVSPGKMSAISFGEYRPLDRTGTPEGNALNRRVDIQIVTGQRYVAPRRGDPGYRPEEVKPDRDLKEEIDEDMKKGLERERLEPPLP